MTHHHHHHHHNEARMSAEMRRRVNVADIDNIHNEAHADYALLQRDADAEVTQTVTAVVATAIDVIIESGSQILTQLTVSSLPTVVTVAPLGVITIPADSGSTTDAVVAAAETATAAANNQIPLGSSTSSLSSTQPTSSSQSTQSTTTSGLTSTPATSTSSEPQSSTLPSSSTSSFTSTTSIISTSTSLSSTSSTSSESSTSSSTISSFSSSTTSSSTTFSSTISSTTSYASSLHSTSTGTQLPTSSSTAAAANSGAGGSDTGKIVGGVVGGVVGLLLLLLLAFLYRKYRERQTPSTASAAGGGVSSKGALAGGPGSHSAEMASHRSSDTPLAAAAVLGRWKSSSSFSARSSTTGERGFQKISGRKIPSVLHTGGDGYGDEIEEEPIPAMPSPPLEATSPVSPVSAIGGGTNRHAPMRHDFSLTGSDMGVGAAVMRPSPARTPTASSVDLSAPSPSQRGVSPLRPDSVGRTLSRYDGSRGSRFTEGI